MAIEQHPIPQDVAGYKFRLIGEMTIKQFAFLASGIILGLIIYSLPLPFFFKYPLAAIAVGLGAGIAFLPVEGRPMDKWLIAFIKSIYSPTQYVWQKQAGSEVITAAKTTTTVGRNSAPAIAPNQSIAPTPTSTPQPVAPQSEAEIPRTPAGPTPPITTPTAVTPPKSQAKPDLAPPDNLPIPFTPTTPNTLVGMTLTPEGKILNGALIEIKTKGISIRATKSNQLGQFLFAKPLENGLYQIYTEKAGFTFDTYSIELRGQIVKPLRLQAKSQTT